MRARAARRACALIAPIVEHNCTSAPYGARARSSRARLHAPDETTIAPMGNVYEPRRRSAACRDIGRMRLTC